MSTTSVELIERDRDRGEDQKDTRSLHETSAPTSETVSEEEVDEESPQDLKEDIKIDDDRNDGRNTADSVFERISEEKTSTSANVSTWKTSSIAEEKETIAEKSTSLDPEYLASGEEVKSVSNSCGGKGNKPVVAADLNLELDAASSKRIPKSPERAPLQRMEHIPDTPTTAVNLKIEEQETPEPGASVEVTEQTRVQEGIQSVLKSFSDPDKNKPSTVWSVDRISPSRVKSLLPEKPNVERLLPIGPPREPSPKPVLFKSYTYHEHHHHHHSHSARDKHLPPFVKSPSEIRVPSQERLLPIGPPQERSRSKSPMTATSPSPAAAQLEPLERVPVPESKTTVPEKEEITKVEEKIMPESVAKPIGEVPPVVIPVTVEKTKSEPLEEEIEKSPPLKEKKKKRKEQKDDKSSGSKSSNGKKSEKSEPTTPKTPNENKQVTAQSTLESLGQSISIDMKDDPGPDPSHQKRKKDPNGKQRYKQRRQRKTGVTSAEVQRSVDSKGGQSVASGGVAANVQRRARKTDGSPSTGFPSKRSSTSQSSVGGGGGTPTTAPTDHDGIHERCLTCNNVYQEFSEEEIGMCIVILRTFIHREPSLAASILPEILKLVSKFTTYFPYPWMTERLVALCSLFNFLIKVDTTF